MQSKTSGKLIEQVSRRCYISSKDELILERLKSIIDNAIYSVKSLLGIYDDKFDFSEPSMENELFLNYCMYRWNNRSQKEFENNYIGDIIAIRTQNEVKYNKEKNSSDEEIDNEQ